MGLAIRRTATEAEAAAIAAAVQQFTVDTAVSQSPAETGPSPWLQTALLEGVSAKESFGPGNPT